MSLGQQTPDRELHRAVVRVQNALHRLDDLGIEDAHRLGVLGQSARPVTEVPTSVPRPSCTAEVTDLSQIALGPSTAGPRG